MITERNKKKENNMERYIYSEKDVRDAIVDVNKDTINLGEDLLEVLIKKIQYNLREYSNLYRFYNRNCCGCVSDNKECDFYYGRGKAENAWEKAKAGEIFDCPVRINGTLCFNTNHPEKGIEKIDISDRDKLPYPIVKSCLGGGTD
jgi:hypothetical protein